MAPPPPPPPPPRPPAPEDGPPPGGRDRGGGARPPTMNGEAQGQQQGPPQPDAALRPPPPPPPPLQQQQEPSRFQQQQHQPPYFVGDIWSTGAFSFESPLKDLLDSENYTLEQLLSEDELLQELRGLHPSLLAYFSSPRAAEALVRHVVGCPPPPPRDHRRRRDRDDGPEERGGFAVDAAAGAAAGAGAGGAPAAAIPGSPGSRRRGEGGGDDSHGGIRFPYVACEVICCEIDAVVDALVDGYAEGEEEEQEEPEPPEEGRSDGRAPSEGQPLEGGGGSSPAAADRQPRPGDHRIIDSGHDAVEVVDFDDDNSGSGSRGGGDEAGVGGAAESAAAGGDVPVPSTASPAQEEGGGSSKKRRGRRILDVLFSLVERPGTCLDEYRAGYLEKVLRVLFRRRPDDMAAYVNGRAGDLLPALLRHLYSPSVLQVVQRLLLPRRPTPKAPGAGAGIGAATASEEDQQGDVERGVSDGEGGERGSLLLEGVEDGGGPGADGGGGGEDDPPGDPLAGEIRSDWAQRPEALEMLLDLLLVANQPGGPEGGGGDPGEDEEREELREQRRLDASLNAAEVLITMVQNSLMSSAVMLTLTSSPVLERLVAGASSLPPGTTKFSPHESPTTAAMSVLESLILQLGGYGPVGTMSVLEDETAAAAAAALEAASDLLAAEIEAAEAAGLDPDPNLYRSRQPGSGRDGEPPAPSSPDPDPAPSVRFADLTSLIDHLPVLLDNLGGLLQHPDCESWKSPTQFSRGVPVQQLGASRLRVVRVLESLVLLGDPDVDARLVQSDCLETCLNLFWDFQWCSMLHQSVANLLVHVMEGQNARVEMQEYFLIRCNLLVRLMDSFVDTTSPSAASGPPRQRLSVSEDDVDAAMERQQEAAGAASSDDDDGSSRAGGGGSSVMDSSAIAAAAASAAAPPPPQSFRYGYMGHVIIVCQALVHACSAASDDGPGAGEGGGSGGGGEASTAASSLPHHAPRQGDEGEGADPLPEHGTSAGSALGSMIASGGTVRQHPLESVSRGGDESTAFSREPLYLLEMVSCHPLSDKWNHFVATTLAAETAIQSTPLGGLNAIALVEAMHMHRPGLADDLDDSGLEPPSRLGDVLDMDDNDLEVAASIMAGLSVSGRARHLDDDDDGSAGDSNRSYNSGETNNSGGGYLFDDPLGRINGGLGIELGKLTKYNPEMDNPDDLLKDDDDDDDDGGDDGDSDGSKGSQGSDHSSDEDEPRRRDSEAEVPVIDLFAGNFDFVDPRAPPSGDAAGQDWSDFANFDDAFAPQPSPVAAPSSGTADESPSDAEAKHSGDFSNPSSSSDLDEIFGAGDHASLLDVDDAVAEGEARKPVEGAESPFLSLAVPPSDGSELDASPPSADSDPADDIDILSAPSDEIKADLSEKHEDSFSQGEGR